MATTQIQQVERRRFNVDEYHRMAEVGILTEDDRVELLGGEVVQMSPIRSRHAACVKRWNRLLSEQLASDWVLGVQDPIRLGTNIELQPDLSVLRLQEDYYANELPSPEDVLIVIEVADTSLSYDRGVKIPLCARAGIPEVWLVDLSAEVVERHSEPSESGYDLTARARRGDSLASTVIPDLSLRAEDVLG